MNLQNFLCEVIHCYRKSCCVFFFSFRVLTNHSKKVSEMDGILDQHLEEAIRPDLVQRFHEHSNSVVNTIKFTYEVKENDHSPFLDVMVHWDEDGRLSTSVYRKKTHTNNSHHPSNHKSAVVHTLLKRADRLSSSLVDRSEEEQQVMKVMKEWRIVTKNISSGDYMYVTDITTPWTVNLNQLLLLFSPTYRGCLIPSKGYCKMILALKPSSDLLDP